ncbi:TonB-dependent receptor [Fulvivirga sp. RKSG066]|uniref:TonB-dependent receptor n=1 Tax=Fulvivirga aurantia TaxID=2529383 RepID=UPI0012BB81F0|nr:TonB-dependent receptor [Fulvivirga aurantia]MTI21854.1 TonB-dependent receptor [Fulvivirga aurantia]
MGKRFLVIVTVLCCGISSSTAQQIELKKSFNNAPVVHLLNYLKQHEGYNFSYASDDLDSTYTSVNQGKYELQRLLKETLSPYFLEAEVVSEKFVLIRKMSHLVMTLKVMNQANEPLPFATIGVRNTTEGFVTDAFGEATIKVKNDSGLVLEIAYLGYKNRLIDPHIEGLDVTISLQPKAKELDEVVIIEYINRGITVNDNTSVVGIDLQNMEILPGLSEPDVLLSTQMLPGITSSDESASSISIRGGTVDQTAYYWNQIPVYSPAHYFGNISAFIPSAIGKVEVHKNTIPVRFGGYTGGLLNLTSRSHDASQPAIEMNINLTQADLYTQVDLPKQLGNLMVAGRRSYNDFLLTPTYSSISEKVFEGSTTSLFQGNVTEDNFDYNSKINFSDINAVWSNQLTNRDSLTLSYLYAYSLLDFESTDTEQLNFTSQSNEATNHGLGFNWQHRWSEHLQTSLNIAHARFELAYGQDNIRETQDDLDQYETRDNDLENTEIRLHNQLNLSRNKKLSFGYQVNQIDAGYTIASLDVFPDGTEDRFSASIGEAGVVHSLYADLELTPTDRWYVGLGARQSLYSFVDEVTFDPQIRLNYKVADAVRVKASAGIFHQYIQSFQESGFTISNAVEQLWILAGADEGREIIENRQASIGFIFSDKGWLIDFDTYKKRLDKLNARKINRTLDAAYSAEENIVGLDLLIKKRFKRLRNWVSYTFQQSEASIPGLNIRNMPSSRNLTHQVQLASAYDFGRLSISSGYTVRSGAPYAFSQSLEEVSRDGFTFNVVNYESVNQRCLPTYSRLDVSAWYHFPVNTTSRLQGEIGISLLNVLNNKNIAERNYGVSETGDGEPILSQTDRYLYGFTPNLSLRLKFL